MKELFLIFLIFPISYSRITKEGQEMVNTCTNALMQKIPPMFCWKKRTKYKNISKIMSKRI